MSFATEASKLLTNKYFLYFIVFLAATNVLGYLVTNKTNAVIFFALVSLLTYQFSKNMAVILLVAIIATNFLMANKRIREGLEVQSQTTTNQTSGTTPATTTHNIDSSKIVDQDIANAMSVVKSSINNDEATKKLSQIHNENTNVSSVNTPDNVIDTNNEDLNGSKIVGPTGAGQTIGNKKATNENFGPRLDYAATIEQSYKNLDQILDTGAITNLTNDTKQLMSQQQKLFDTMQNMVPVLQGAQNLLKDFKIDGLAESLKSIGGLAGAQIPAINK